MDEVVNIKKVAIEYCKEYKTIEHEIRYIPEWCELESYQFI